MNITELPENVILKITSYLPIEDLLVCCRVNKRWRNILNNDELWSKLCYDHFHMDKTQLIKRPSLAKQFYSTHSSASMDLSALCTSRLLYMQQKHVNCNWRNGKYVTYLLADVKSPDIQCEGEILVVLDQTDYRFSIYNIEGKPKKVQTLELKVKKNRSFFKLCNGVIVLCQGTLVHVYKKVKANTFELIQQCIFNTTEEESLNIPQLPDLTEWYENNIAVTICGSFTTVNHNGDYLVARLSKGIPRQAEFHVWDLKTGQKTFKCQLPGNNVLLSDFHFFDSTLYIRIFNERKNKFQTTILSFNLSSLTFNDNFKMTYEGGLASPIFDDKLIITTDNSRNNVQFWKRNDGSFLDELFCGFPVYLKALKASSPFMIYGGELNSSGIVRNFNTETFQPTCELTAGFSAGSLHFIHHNLILVCGLLSKIEVWDLPTKTKLHSLEGRIIWISPCRSKVILGVGGARRKFYLLHFW